MIDKLGIFVDSELPIALEPESFADPGKDNKTKELYAFFKQALLEQPGPYQVYLILTVGPKV